MIMENNINLHLFFCFLFNSILLIHSKFKTVAKVAPNIKNKAKPIKNDIFGFMFK